MVAEKFADEDSEGETRTETRYRPSAIFEFPRILPLRFLRIRLATSSEGVG